MKTAALLVSLAAVTANAKAVELGGIPFETIDGKKTSLADYRGKAVLIVNTASQCGLTPQYAGLEALHDRFQAAGLVVLGFPCNDFGNQEPGSSDEIQRFCKTSFDVSFPLMAKIHVKGPERHPLYTALSGEGAAFPGDVTWNFGKFLIGKDGKPLARFEPAQKPDSPEVVTAIEQALK